MYSIGLDISKSSINVYIPLGKLDLEIANSLKSFKSLYSKVKKLYKKEIDKITFVFESTGSYSVLLYKFCSAKNIKVFMINPKQARNFARAIAQRNKSDIIDAQVLSQSIVVARTNEIKIPVIDPIVEEMKELMVYYRLKIKQRVQLSNHLESLVSRDGSKVLVKRDGWPVWCVFCRLIFIIFLCYNYFILKLTRRYYEKYRFISSSCFGNEFVRGSRRRYRSGRRTGSS